MLVCNCLNGKYFLWRLSQMPLEGKMSTVGGRPLRGRFFDGVLIFL